MNAFARLCLVLLPLSPFAGLAEEAVPEPAKSVREIEWLPGLYRVAGRGGDVGSVFLIKTAEPVLIDCGSRTGWKQLVGNLKLLGLTPGDIKWVVATHGHWDHMDAMTILRKEYPAVKFAIHAGDAQAVIHDDRVFSCAEPLYRGVPSGPVRVDKVLLDEDTLPAGGVTLRILHTPGHTPGSIVVLADIAGKKVAFSGDSIGGYYSSLNRSSVIDWQLSMGKLLKVEIDMLCTGHATEPMTDRAGIRQALEAALRAAVLKREQLAKEEAYGSLPDPGAK